MDCRARTRKRGIRCSAFGYKAAITVIPEQVSRTNEVETEIRPNHEHSWDGKEQVKLVGNNVQFTHRARLQFVVGESTT